MKINLLAPTELALKWHTLEPLVKKAVFHGEHETDTVVYLNRALNYQAQIWEITDNEGQTKGVVVTQFLNYSNYQTLHLVALAGTDLDKWVHLYYEIERFANNNKCTAVESWGRKGWSKYLPKVLPGFYESYVVMRKNLKHEDPEHKT